jgi:hypothetical protein
MINARYKRQLLEQVDRLGDQQQQQLLAFARSLVGQRPTGVPGKELLPFAGAIEADDLSVIARAIQDGCEKIDLDEW